MESVKKQIDYYFSIDNLCKDIFLRSKVRSSPIRTCSSPIHSSYSFPLSFSSILFCPPIRWTTKVGSFLQSSQTSTGSGCSPPT